MKNKTINLILRSAILLTLIFTGCNNNNENKSNSENKESISENSELDGEVTIGTQKWMSANLDVKAFRNGEAIPQAKTDEEWTQAGDNNQPAWCYYDNDPTNGTKFGKLYNWYAVNDLRGLAPLGYHIPTDAEWTILADFLGGENVAGVKMKSKEGWFEKGNGTNSSGFSGLPGGSRLYDDGIFFNIANLGFWWSSSECDTLTTWSRTLNFSNGNLVRLNDIKRDGYSVRCLRD
jgi:uncharacterized protein (TIGR02145 family)